MKSLYFLLILTGSIPIVPSVSRKYFIIREGKNWTDAQAYCRATYTHLAIINNNDYLTQFQSDSQKQQLNFSAWIGMYNDINSWRWSFGNEPLGSMRKWLGSEPNNGGGRQECGTIARNGWTDKGCSAKYPFVCLNDRGTGAERFIYISDNVTWFAAQSYCRTYHTDLASTRDATEYSTITSLISSEAWIGLFRDSWKWVDKTNFSTINWMRSQPNNNQSHENCGYINNTVAGDALCSDVMPFICYKGYPRKTMLRVKVRSDQDMKDPAVQLIILELLKQKLKDNLMTENITVKWRKQPDGLVFHKQKVSDQGVGVVDELECSYREP